MKTIIIGLLFTTFITISCKTKDGSSSTPVTEEQAKMDKEILSAGYVNATVKDFSSHGECGFLLLLEDGSYLQPKSLETHYKKDEMKVWLKYHAVKPIAIDCDKGIPVIVDEIKEKQ